MSNKKEDYSHRLFEQLDRIFIKDSFQNEVKKLRKELGIPNDGFLTWEKWVECAKRDFKKKALMRWNIASQSVKLNVRLGLSHNFYFWIEAYIVLGENYMEYKIDSPIKNLSTGKPFALKPDYCNAMDFEEGFDCLNIKLYPRASVRETLEYISRNKKIIKTYLSTLDRRPKAIRKRNKKDLHNLLYEFYKKDWVNKYGVINIEYNDSLPSEIKNIDMDVRRNIIQKQIKDRS
jgi:hypothetical protein